LKSSWGPAAMGWSSHQSEGKLWTDRHIHAQIQSGKDTTHSHRHAGLRLGDRHPLAPGRQPTHDNWCFSWGDWKVLPNVPGGLTEGHRPCSLTAYASLFCKTRQCLPDPKIRSLSHIWWLVSVTPTLKAETEDFKFQPSRATEQDLISKPYYIARRSGSRL
jgi:hypothetical protein